MNSKRPATEFSINGFIQASVWCNCFRRLKYCKLRSRRRGHLRMGPGFGDTAGRRFVRA